MYATICGKFCLNKDDAANHVILIRVNITKQVGI